MACHTPPFEQAKKQETRGSAITQPQFHPIYILCQILNFLGHP